MTPKNHCDAVISSSLSSMRRQHTQLANCVLHNDCRTSSSSIISSLSSPFRGWSTNHRAQLQCVPFHSAHRRCFSFVFVLQALPDHTLYRHRLFIWRLSCECCFFGSQDVIHVYLPRSHPISIFTSCFSVDVIAHRKLFISFHYLVFETSVKASKFSLTIYLHVHMLIRAIIREQRCTVPLLSPRPPGPHRVHCTPPNIPTSAQSSVAHLLRQ